VSETPRRYSDTPKCECGRLHAATVEEAVWEQVTSSVGDPAALETLAGETESTRGQDAAVERQQLDALEPRIATLENQIADEFAGLRAERSIHGARRHPSEQRVAPQPAWRGSGAAFQAGRCSPPVRSRRADWVEREHSDPRARVGSLSPRTGPRSAPRSQSQVPGRTRWVGERECEPAMDGRGQIVALRRSRAYGGTLRLS
jgi:hypothetical protein